MAAYERALEIEPDNKANQDSLKQARNKLRKVQYADYTFLSMCVKPRVYISFVVKEFFSLVHIVVPSPHLVVSCNFAFDTLSLLPLTQVTTTTGSKQGSTPSGGMDLPAGIPPGMLKNPAVKQAMDQMGGPAGLASLMKDPQMMAMAQQMMKVLCFLYAHCYC